VQASSIACCFGGCSRSRIGCGKGGGGVISGLNTSKNRLKLDK